jgi:ribonuclease J
MPLVTIQNEPFGSNLLAGKSIPELIDSHILPKVTGLYDEGKTGIDAILLSHSHQDHYGLLQYNNPAIPVYLTSGAQALINASDLFIPIKANLRNAKVFEKRKSFTVGDFTITPRLVDHSAVDAVAFLIQGEDKRIFFPEISGLMVGREFSSIICALNPLGTSIISCSKVLC